MFLLRARQQNAEGEFVSAMGVVCQLGDGDVVAVTDLEIVLLEAELEDESVGILNTVAEPDTDKEGHPVKIYTVVEIVKTRLILIYKVG